ncbi:MAG: TolC family protein [Candidatus Omnitrophica bacterium]|nr:TolC family protein [Candidatus Omnitrophota bacterium]MCM8793330.1 TolC family protein [Candidatus Omnitrophota bacterium]
MKRSILFILLLGNFLLSAEEPIRLTLEEAINIALRENREVLFKQQDLMKTKEKLKEAKAEALPTFSIESSWLETKNYYSKDIDSYTNKFSLKQPLYKGGKITGNISQYKYRIDISKAGLDMAILETVFKVKKAFFSLLLAREYAQLNRLILVNTESHLRMATERYLSGQSAQSEIIKLQQALASIKHILNSSLNQIEEAKENLKNILYLAKDVEIEPEGELLYEPIEIAFDEAYLKALRERPDLRLYEIQEKMNKLQKEIARANLLPNIYASWDYYINRSDSPIAISQGWEGHQIMGIVMTWPIFDGFATQAKIRQAELELKETQLLKEKTVADIFEELKIAYLELNNAIAKLKARDAEVSLFEDNLQTVTERYNSGIASGLDLDDARLKLEIAEFNRKEVVYDYLIARAKLEKAIGEMK